MKKYTAAQLRKARAIVDQEEAIELERDKRAKARREVRIQTAKDAVPRIPTIAPATKRKAKSLIVRSVKVWLFLTVGLGLVASWLAILITSLARS
jgi:hypothetical protein